MDDRTDRTDRTDRGTLSYMFFLGILFFFVFFVFLYGVLVCFFWCLKLMPETTVKKSFTLRRTCHHSLGVSFRHSPPRRVRFGFLRPSTLPRGSSWRLRGKTNNEKEQ